ncbi:MAG: TetR family transcriptional regulator [Acidimicrobiales bacterium]
MAELVRRSGLPAATVRHYLREGLLPHPVRSSSNRHLYDERHVQALRLARLLRERRHLSVPEVRDALPELLDMPGEEAFRSQMWAAVGIASPSPAAAGVRARILDAGLSTFSSSGFGEVTVDDVCREAGVAKGSFYRHFSSKEELFFATALEAGRRIAGELGDALPEPEPGRPEAGASASAPGEMAPGEMAPGEIALGGDPCERLSAALVPRMPLLLDLLSLAARHQGVHARVAGEVFAVLAIAASHATGHRAVEDVLCAAMGAALALALAEGARAGGGGAAGAPRRELRAAEGSGAAGRPRALPGARPDRRAPPGDR